MSTSNRIVFSTQLLFAALLITLSHGAAAQDIELKIMYSPVSLLRMDTWINGTGVKVGEAIDSESNHPGAFMMDCNMQISKKLKAGINVTYDYRKTTDDSKYNYTPPWPNNDRTTTRYITDVSKSKWLMFGPQIGYNYLQKDNFTLGCLLGLSLVWNTERIEGDLSNSKSSAIDVFFHAEVISFTLGKNNGLTGQVGFGHKGLCSIGYFFRW